MIPAVLGLTAWIAKGVVLTALPRLLKAVTDRCSPTPKTSPTPPVRLNQAVPQLRNRAIVYAYDNLSQLVGVNINQTPAASFQFDPAGNLLSLTVGNTTTGFTYNALNQRTTPGVNVYDPKGQTTDKDGRTFEWDDDGRMTAIVDGTHRSEFAYDGYGRRIKIAEFDNGNLTSKKLYWWLGGQIVCERDGIDPAFPITKRYFGQGVVVGAERLYYTMDQLGSVRELVDSSGVVRADYRYSTYGERTKVGGDLDSDWGYAGLFHHGPSGLDLATYRVYDSKMGRWISRDPLGEGVDYNLYRYCGNNPISSMDPSGLWPPQGDDEGVSYPNQGPIKIMEFLANIRTLRDDPETLVELYILNTTEIEYTGTLKVTYWRVPTNAPPCEKRDAVSKEVEVTILPWSKSPIDKAPELGPIRWQPKNITISARNVPGTTWNYLIEFSGRPNPTVGQMMAAAVSKNKLYPVTFSQIKRLYFPLPGEGL